MLAAQIFFFLRDLGHRHQHHDPYTDTIVDLYKENNRDEFEWKLLTLYSLYRKVITYKRIRHPESFASSRGVLAYADTFRKLIECKISAKDQDRLPKFFSENVFASIDAIDQAMRRNYEVAQAAAAVTREITLAIIGTAIAVIGVLQFTDTKVHEKPSPTLIGLAKLFITSPIVTIAVIGSCIWATRMLFGVTDYRKYRIIRWLNRVLQPFDLRITITIFLLFGIMMAFGQYLILF